MPISTISIDVDQLTFLSWSQAMANLMQSFTVPVITVSAIPNVQMPVSLSFTGVELLNEVGRAMARPNIIDDPDRLFALFRYGTKVSSRTANFRLSVQRPIRDIHKSSVLSDEIGAGFALLFGSRVLGASVFLDLPDAVREGRVITPAPPSTVPDYIGLYGPLGSTVILEAKGSQSRRYCRSRQIPKGCTQVASVSLPLGNSALRVVVGTRIGKESSTFDSTMFVGDPAEKRAYKYFQDQEPQAIVVREHYRRIAALTGDVELFRHAERSDPIEGGVSHLVQRQLGARKAVGSLFAVRSGMGSVGFFVGVELRTREELLANLSKPEPTKVPAVDPETAQHRESNMQSNYSIARDGTVFELWFEGEIVKRIARE